MKQKIGPIVYIVLIFLPIVMVSSCLWTPKKWGEIQDRQYYFQKFHYVCKGDDENNALKLMKAIPVKDIFKQLEVTYNIKIDTADFDAFSEANDPKKIKVYRFLQKESFGWKTEKPGKNRIELYYYVIFDTETNMSEKKFKLLVVGDKHVRAIYFGDIDSYDEIGPKLIKEIKTRKY